MRERRTKGRVAGTRTALLWALALCAGALGCGKDGAALGPRGPRAITVEAVTVAKGEIRDVLDLVGQLEAEESVVLKPEAEGVVESVEFREGDRVERGALLFRLRDDEQQARLRELQAQVDLAKQEFERIKTLARQKTVSEAELDRATAAWQAAAARRDMGQVELERTAIRAPFDGALGARLVSPGDRVDRDTKLVQIDAVRRLRLVFSVPEVAIPAVSNGDEVEIRVAPWPERRFAGKVYFVAPSLDPRNRRLLLKAWVPNSDDVLRPGLFANIALELAHHDDAVVVPESAVAYDADGPFVWRLLGDETAERVAVELGIRSKGRVELTAGVRPGQRIVSAGTHKVVAGAPLRIVAAAPEVEPTTAAPAAGGPA